MQTQPYCLACALQQAWRSVQIATSDPNVQIEYLREVAAYVARAPLADSPAGHSSPIYELLARVTGNPDVFAGVRREQNALALRLLGHVEAAVRAHADPLAAAARVAGAGNLIDNGVGVPEDIEKTLIAAADEPFARDETGLFFEALRNGARELLYLHDNAGEIVFDRLFIQILKERHPGLRVVSCVKSGPILNDVTLADAAETGLDRVSDAVIPSGNAWVGTPLDKAGPELRAALERMDLYLAKGQGNFETLEDFPGGYLLLTSKCAMVAAALGVEEGEKVFIRSGPAGKKR